MLTNGNAQNTMNQALQALTSKYQNVLPGTYGAIFKLTQIKETKLKSLLDSGKITSSTTRQTINILT